MSKHRGERFLLLLLVLTSLLPNPRAAFPGLSYYFRDFTVTFYPIRLFAAQELRAGRLAFWNPYFNEGAFALPVLYPLDLLHAFFSSPDAVSWLLTLHFPLAALAMYVLARDLEVGRLGAFLAGALYSLGGLALSSLNLYVFLQALAWAPLVAATLRRAAIRGGRWIPWAALPLAFSLSTLAVEFVGQALLLGWALGWVARVGRPGLYRMALATAIGAGLAAVPVALVAGMLPETVRGAGFDPAVALGNELHPVAMLQVVIAGLFGSLAFPVEVWWGGAFFTKGFPYFLSIYLGPLTPALAVLGAGGLAPAVRRALLGLSCLALWYALGARGGLAPIIAALPGLGSFRFPSKALLLPYLAAALLVASGVELLRQGQGWPRFRRLAALTLCVPILVGCFLWMAPMAAGWLAVPESTLPSIRAFVLGQCAWSVALILLGLALARRSGLRAPSRGAGLIVALVVADLARAGAGTNPQVHPSFFRLLPELVAESLDSLEGGRVFTYGLDHSPTFLDYLKRPSPGSAVGLWSFFVNRQLLSPYNNILDRVEMPDAKDLTSFVIRPPELSEQDYDPRRVSATLPRLRNAAVSRVLSLDPLEAPGLTLRRVIPTGRPGLAIHLYGLAPTAPRAYVACRVFEAHGPEEARARAVQQAFDGARDVVLERPGAATCSEGQAGRLAVAAGEDRFRVSLDGDGYLVSRDSHASGWKALVDGAPQPVLRANGKHRAVALRSGVHDIVLKYEPPGLRLGLWLFGVSFGFFVLLCVFPVLEGEPEPLVA